MSEEVDRQRQDTHVPLLSDYDEPTTLSNQIPLFGTVSADVRQTALT